MKEYQQEIHEFNADKAPLATMANPVVHPHTFYIVYGTRHSGISHLCNALGSTQVAGKPAEYFTSPHDLKYAEQWGISLCNDPLYHFDDAYTKRAIAAGTTPNGILGVKALWPGIPYCLELSCANRLPPCQYIMIMRRDKVRQAIAWWQDLEIARWLKQGGNSKEVREKPVFDFDAIEFLRQAITNYERNLLKFFSINDIQPFIVVYEDFITSYEETVSQILDYLHIPAPADLGFNKRSMQKLSNEQTEEWVQRYYQMKYE